MASALQRYERLYDRGEAEEEREQKLPQRCNLEAGNFWQQQEGGER